MALFELETAPKEHDNHVDETISSCLNPNDPKSFFLYAGAGSGKTRSLVEALKFFGKTHGQNFFNESKKVAVVTYTNAACDEITERVRLQSEAYLNLFHISTIHSFCWLLIGNFHRDIQAELLSKIPAEISEIQEKERKGRGGKASADRQRKIQALQDRLEWLKTPRKFTYNPNGDNFGKASLSHAEVLELAASFIVKKPMMKEAVVRSYPFLLIDESQDTNKGLIDAFFALEQEKKGQFAIGLLGDQMQRIYLDGKERLDTLIPDHWAKPAKSLNHRCPRRVIQLSNTLRQLGDKQVQKAREDAIDGTVRLFIADSNKPNKTEIENTVKAKMATIASDELWNKPEEVKSLTLEHHMAANRMGFLELFLTLDSNSRLSTGVRDGTLPSLRFFKDVIDSIAKAKTSGNQFELMDLCRRNSPLLESNEILSAISEERSPRDDPLKEIRELVSRVTDTVNRENSTFEDVLQEVSSDKFLSVPEALRPFVKVEPSSSAPAVEDNEADEEPKDISAVWRQFLELPYKQIGPYSSYVSGHAEFDTHQGVKGREFDRVCVVIDDKDARGRLFSFEKVFGVKEMSDTDKKNEKEGKENSFDRTLKLLYVTCTRAQKSLALIVYTENPKQLKKNAIERNWFLDSEVEVL